MSNEENIKKLEEKRNKINSVSPSFCTAKWLQTTLYLQNGYNHSCHHPSPHKIPLEEVLNSPSSLHNSQFKKLQRRLMLAGERPKECDYCWKIEDLGKNYFSDRHYKSADYWAWDRFNEVSRSKADDDFFPSYLEISFSNACNFACSYCSPEISSKWMDDIRNNGPYPVIHGSHDLNYLQKIGKIPYLQSEENPYLNAFWKWFPNCLPFLKVLRITGGEPTMSKDLWRLLDFIKENPQPNLELAINTNMGTPKNLIERLQKYVNLLQDNLKKIDIYTSIESTDKIAEYSRDGLDFKYWKSNVEDFLTNTNSTVAIMTTINILSLHDFENFIDLIMSLRVKYNTCFEYNRIPFTVNYLRWPLHLQCTLIDLELRIGIADAIETKCQSYLKYYSKEKYARIYLEEFDQIKRFCDYLRSEPVNKELRKDFVNFIVAYDKRRNKNFKEDFPMFSGYLEEWHA